MSKADLEWSWLRLNPTFAAAQKLDVKEIPMFCRRALPHVVKLLSPSVKMFPLSVESIPAE